MRLLFKSFREIHFTVANEARSFRQFVAKPDDQEQRNANIGSRDGAPVNGVRKEGLIVLAQGNDQAQNEGEDRPQREEP
ncbi:Uncharacterised protein [Enterobacter cloacae]|nr:Uncharacterised protein [Enterobacter cloacae]